MANPWTIVRRRMRSRFYRHKSLFWGMSRSVSPGCGKVFAGHPKTRCESGGEHKLLPGGFYLTQESQSGYVLPLLQVRGLVAETGPKYRIQRFISAAQQPAQDEAAPKPVSPAPGRCRIANRRGDGAGGHQRRSCRSNFGFLERLYHLMVAAEAMDHELRLASPLLRDQWSW